MQLDFSCGRKVPDFFFFLNEQLQLGWKWISLVVDLCFCTLPSQEKIVMETTVPCLLSKRETGLTGGGWVKLQSSRGLIKLFEVINCMLAAGREGCLWNAILFISNLVHAIYFKIKGWRKVIYLLPDYIEHCNFLRWCTQQEIEIK